MRLQVVVPAHVAVSQEVTKVVVESTAGSFCMLPRHMDVVAELVPGLLSYVTGDTETFLAVDGGTVVKRGDEVRVATPHAVVGPELERLRQAIDEDFQERAERERDARTALAHLQADVVHIALELQEREG